MLTKFFSCLIYICLIISYHISVEKPLVDLAPKKEHKFINFFLYRIDESDTAILAFALLIPLIGNYAETLDVYFHTFMTSGKMLLFVVLVCVWLILVIFNALSNRVPGVGEKYHLAQMYFLIVSLLSFDSLIGDKSQIYSLPQLKDANSFYFYFNFVLTWIFLLKSIITILIIRSIDKYSVLLTDKYTNRQLSIFGVLFLLTLMPVIYALHVLNHNIITSVYLTFAYTSTIFMGIKRVNPEVFKISPRQKS